jgi:hypothetical protein
MSFSQENVVQNKDEIAQIRLKKQIILADLEGQLKNIPFAAVRVYARYRIASWLWKDGKDDTGRAEDIAVTAIEDHYKNKDEMPPGYSSRARLFVLLDTHAKDTAKRLREKYKFSSAEEAGQILALLDQKNGEKLAVDAALRLLSQPNENAPDLGYLLMLLEQQGSPELNRLLGAILAADQMGRMRLPTHMIEMLTGFFIKPDVPADMARQFIRLVLARSRNVAALSVLDQMAYSRTLQRLWPDITTKYPDMVAEAGTIYAFLTAQVNRSTREANERFERINNSADKLAAAVAEAERVDNNTEKYGLYRYAARLALEKKKFVYAADLMEKASEIDMGVSSTPEDFRKGMHDQFYRDVIMKALEADEPDGASHAVKKMNTPLSKAENLRHISKYYIDKKDLASGREAHDEAIKLISRVESSPEAISTLVEMLPISHMVDSARADELTQMIAKKIGAIPTLNAEDKPNTKNYRDYVVKIMKINGNLFTVLTQLVKENRGAVADIGGRIEKKEIRIIADYVLLTDSIDSLPKQKKKTTESSKLTLQDSALSAARRNLM